MKLIVAVIRPENLGAVEAALNPCEATVMSVSQVLGSGREPGYKEIYRGREIHVRRPKLRVEIAAEDGAVKSAAEAVARAGSTAAEPGGGCKVVVLDLDGWVRIRDGEPEAAVGGR